MDADCEKRENETLMRMLKTPPKPHAPIKGRKTKASRGSPAKVEEASTSASKADDGEA